MSAEWCSLISPQLMDLIFIQTVVSKPSVILLCRLDDSQVRKSASFVGRSSLVRSFAVCVEKSEFGQVSPQSTRRPRPSKAAKTRTGQPSQPQHLHRQPTSVPNPVCSIDVGDRSTVAISYPALRWKCERDLGAGQVVGAQARLPGKAPLEAVNTLLQQDSIFRAFPSCLTDGCF